MGDETILAIHVPDPRIAQFDVDPAATTFGHDVLLDIVREVETPFGLDHETEHGADIPILAVKLQFDIGLVLFEILSAHCDLPTRQ
jgi:hypothetical protein